MQISEHDEFLHLGYPREGSDPWKENYYFNYIDRNADAMGIFHCSFMRSKNQVRLMSHQLVDGQQFSYVEYLDLPISDPQLLDDRLIMKSDRWRFEVSEPHTKHLLSYREENFAVELQFAKRFEVFNFGDSVASAEDKGFDVAHYEQGMSVKGTVTLGGSPRAIDCFGHRDHTWGFRQESGLAGWHWIAIHGDRSAWNITRVKRIDTADDQAGFCSDSGTARSVSSVEVLSIEYDERDEPTVCRYRVGFNNGETRTVTATRFARLNLGRSDEGVVFHENFSDFLIEETGETGVGVDEHMVVLKS